jgi:nitrite reductase (NO-forming)
MWGAVVFTGALSMSCQSGPDDSSTRAPAVVHETRPAARPVQLHVHPGPSIFPAEPERRKEIHLEAVTALVELGDGKLASWSFGGQIPGPTLRVREGDRVHFTVVNRTATPLAGTSLAAGPVSLDLGGAFLFDREHEGRIVAPGETLEIEGTAMNPGVFIYTGGPTPAEAITTGLYGMLIVDPLQGYGSEAQREYALVQSELYAGAAGPIKVLDREALKGKRPTHFGYGGRFAPAGEHLRLDAEPDERLRLFVLDVGPNVPARFQVADIPFDRVWPADLLGEKATSAGPARLEPGKGAVVELVIPKKPGRYRLSDRQFGDRGLWAMIDAARGQPEPPTAAMLAALRPRTPAERRARGHEIFSERCASCHTPPEGTMRMAPDLDGVLKRRSRQWLVSWLTDPPKMQAEDPIASELLKQWNNVAMPPVMLSPDQIEWVLEFIGSGAGKKI